MRRGGQRERQRQQPQPRAEHERQRGRHHQQRRRPAGRRSSAAPRRPAPRSPPARRSPRSARPRAGWKTCARGGLLDQLDRPAALGTRVRSGPHADLDQGRVLRRETGRRSATSARPRLPVSNTTVETNSGCRCSGRRESGRSAARARARRAGTRAFTASRGGPRQALLLGRRIAARGARACAPRSPPGVGLRLVAACERRKYSSRDLAGGGVDERAGAVDHLARACSSASSRQHRRAACRRPSLVVGHVARQAALQPRARAARSAVRTVLRELALDQHHHRLVAEVLLEALGGLEALRGAVRRACRWRRSGSSRSASAAPPSASSARRRRAPAAAGASTEAHDAAEGVSSLTQSA